VEVVDSDRLPAVHLVDLQAAEASGLLRAAEASGLLRVVPRPPVDLGLPRAAQPLVAASAPLPAAVLAPAPEAPVAHRSPAARST